MIIDLDKLLVIFDVGGLFMVVQLAEVALLLEQLAMVVLTIDPVLVRYVVQRGNQTPSTSTPEASLVIRLSIDGHLKTQSRDEKGFSNPS